MGEYLGTTVGLEFQFADSQMTEKILLSCMGKDLVVLPIHDSYICQRHRVAEMISAMRQAYAEVIGGEPVIKPVEAYKSDYGFPSHSSGEVDRDALYAMHSESAHNRYAATWRKLHQGKDAPPITIK